MTEETAPVTEQVTIDNVKAEEVQVPLTPEEQVPPAPPAQEQKEPDMMQIVVIGKQSSGKTNMLAAIIKNCLERDYYFRSHFEGVNVQLRELVEPDVRNVTTTTPDSQ